MSTTTNKVSAVPAIETAVSIVEAAVASPVLPTLTEEALTELAVMGQEEEEHLVLETNLLENNDDDWFQAAGPSTASGRKTQRFSSGGKKNIKKIKEMLNLRSPSPALSDITSVSTPAAEEDSDDEWVKFLEEEQERRAAEEARRVEWSRRAAGRRGTADRKLLRARELVSALKGEEKSLKNQREALRAQLRALDDQEQALDRRKHSALLSMRKYEGIVAKYKAMDI